MEMLGCTCSSSLNVVSILVAGKFSVTVLVVRFLLTRKLIASERWETDPSFFRVVILFALESLMEKRNG